MEQFVQVTYSLNSPPRASAVGLGREARQAWAISLGLGWAELGRCHPGSCGTLDWYNTRIRSFATWKYCEEKVLRWGDCMDYIEVTV